MYDGRVKSRALFALALSAVAAGCGEERPPVWAYISPAIIQPNCATSSCHSRLTAVAGLDLSEIDGGYRSLMTQRLPNDGIRERERYNEGRGSPRQLVTPGNPAGSRLINMLRGRGAPLMPPDRPLAEANIELIEQWILEGATHE